MDMTILDLVSVAVFLRGIEVIIGGLAFASIKVNVLGRIKTIAPPPSSLEQEQEQEQEVANGSGSGSGSGGSTVSAVLTSIIAALPIFLMVIAMLLLISEIVVLAVAVTSFAVVPLLVKPLVNR
jgi:hypothetical protein